MSGCQQLSAAAEWPRSPKRRSSLVRRALRLREAELIVADLELVVGCKRPNQRGAGHAENWREAHDYPRFGAKGV
jgi:hypothetical protein